MVEGAIAGRLCLTSAAESVSLFWPLVLYASLVLVVIIGMVGLSFLLGQRHKERATGEPFESGIPPTGPGRPRFHVRYYLVAVFFVVFDLESAFIFAWAVGFRELGWPGYATLAVFVGILLILLFYEIRTGGLDFVTRVKRRSLPAADIAGPRGSRP
jgi:NADH-quinone oxidoreductase subunit A